MKFIQEQINFIDNVKVGIEGPTGTFTIASSKGNLSVTHEYCPCSDFLSMMLPCRYIFAVRVKQNMPLYSESLVHERWKTSFYLTKQRIANQESIQVGDHHVYRSEPKMKTLTITEKRKSATLVANSLVNTLSMASGSEFNHKLNFLKRIDDAWKSGKEINIDIPNSDSQIGKTLIDEEENEKLVMSVDTEVNSQGDESARESHLPNITIEPQTTYEERKVTLENEKENLSENINIELPLKIKKRGRPRGHDTTVIGLKKKRNKIVPLKFALKISESQDCYILRHVINDDIEVTEETLLNPSFEVVVEDLKNEIPDCVLDDSVNLARLKRYFVTDAWEYFSFMLNDKKSKEDWTCRSCAMQLGNRPSIVCESCLFWFHLECSALTKLPRIKTWFCIYCYNKL
ncbi:uncharacterized protein LOC116169839 [Photinus pyralis]|uniref:uncharacterized protein LOC116159358 n=1 Tax=Photinus pyralis TaxID=7054 RepID=UPI00126754BE|nr:uncharacterized protein LOC116159358 [Photinus pyralis]XP_031341878.1 uncharacterized protein LOC116169839 [Photinus pyralis]